MQWFYSIITRITLIFEPDVVSEVTSWQLHTLRYNYIAAGSSNLLAMLFHGCFAKRKAKERQCSSTLAVTFCRISFFVIVSYLGPNHHVHRRYMYKPPCSRSLMADVWDGILRLIFLEHCETDLSQKQCSHI